jgi:S-adenosylmethionine:tRNA ribosyltransferase-isomerase
MHPKNLSIKDYTYSLPAEKIPFHPLEERDASRLLVYKKGIIQEDLYKSLPLIIAPESVLVFNNTKVVEARLIFQKETGGAIEIFCLEPDERYKDITTGMRQQGYVLWKCLVGGASKWKPGQVLQKIIKTGTHTINLEARFVEKLSDAFLIELSWNPFSFTFAEVLHYAGFIPLPPYIKRNPDTKDLERYQTVYAQQEGSVAAPTAGLHFTQQLLTALQEKNCTAAFVSLHVGAGTFKPVKAALLEEHEMHAEFFEVDIATLNLLKQNAGKIYAVGTTSLRTIESLYWMGVKTIKQPAIKAEQLSITQWEVYDTLAAAEVPVPEALESLLQWMQRNKLTRILSKTQILIAPGYNLKTIKGLITNFHQPESTLLLLVAALIGDDWKKVYNYALENNFKFLSYGDGCLLEP